VAATAAHDAPLPWPARLAVDSGLKPETVALKGAGWKPMGTIEPVTTSLAHIHLGIAGSKSAAKGQEEDWKLFTSRVSDSAAAYTPQFERVGAFVYVDAYEDESTTPASSRAAFKFKFVSARPPVSLKPGDPAKCVLERTWFALYDPLPPRTAPGEPAATEVPPPRGLVVVLPGTFGTPLDQIMGLVRRLRQEGYCVLRMLAQPSRFTESVTYPLPLEGDMSASIPVIAADLNDRAAEAAYAVEAAVMYTRQERPELLKLPRAVLGMSGGAMLLPVVVAREPHAYAGSVCIAGGVDYLRILSTSNYADWIDAVRIAWVGGAPMPPPAGADPAPKTGSPIAGGTPAAPTVSPAPPAKPAPSAAQLEQMSRLYRAAAPLDSANLAAVVKSIPWLVVHGSSDKAVPAASGDEMWEMLGKPERIVVKGGHEWVFMTLPGKFNAICDWLNARIPPVLAPAAPANPEPAPAGAAR
jgi:pimeloyl-ACP methyl ester carboxylesterase